MEMQYLQLILQKEMKQEIDWFGVGQKASDDLIKRKMLDFSENQY